MPNKLKYEELDRLYFESNRKAENLYKCLFEECHSIMLIIHPESGYILDANIAACNYYGYNKQELLKMKIMDINTLSQEEIYEEMQNAKLQKRIYFNFRHCLKSGEIRDVEVFSGPVIFDRETVLYSIIHDISERKLIEEQILREKNVSESLIKSLPGIMYLFDEFGVFHRWNKNLEKISGYSNQEIKSMNPLNFIASNDKASVKKSIDEVFEHGETRVEAGILTKKGVVIPYLLTGFRFISNHVKDLIVVKCRNINFLYWSKQNNSVFNPI